ncbi:sulfotransferase domain-containing protein [Coraliomargarita sp. SDUM461004]|uniref:Sulfotransferase domain-containing protein n=1 Tax=Thalassobacterium sedimentorum TaxID=3041258 RepID=A0ABU1AK18_9BACT|nr:sulfotransferase domain-containing protein [Coraliomargarita sp. SDUM461004]MDQ8195155.1 sulfotransferase domain-containing protein [Coraliomargarita sp. SDUM461004]
MFNFLRKKQPCLYHVTHAKAGSSWIYKILKKAYRENVADRIGSDYARIQCQPDVIYAAIFADYNTFLEAKPSADSKCFYVIRDIRDTMVSLYFSHRYSHILSPSIEQRRKVLEGMSEAEGLELYFKTKADRIMNAQRSWVDAGVPVYKYETIFESQGALLFEILDQLQYRYNYKRLNEAIQKSSFEKSFGREPGETDKFSHGRNGTAGNWAEHATPEIEAIIQTQMTDHLKLTGYL